MRHLKTSLAAIGTAVILVLAGNTISLAAAGQGFILGQGNSASTMSTLARTTSGPVLRVTSKSVTNAPFSVNGHGRVANLNADLLDGLDSTALGTRTMLTEGTVDNGNTFGFTFSTPTMPAGHYLASFQAFIFGPVTGSNPGLECWISPADRGRILESWLPYNSFGGTTGYYTINVSGVLTLATAQTVTAHCDGPQGNYSTANGEPAQVSLTRISQFSTSTTLSGARSLARGTAR